MKRGEMSTPSAEPSWPTSVASTCVLSPSPQPMSSTRSPGRGGQRSIAAAPWGASPPMTRWRNLRNRSKSTPSQARCDSAFSGRTFVTGRSGYQHDLAELAAGRERVVGLLGAVERIRRVHGNDNAPVGEERQDVGLEATDHVGLLLA